MDKEQVTSPPAETEELLHQPLSIKGQIKYFFILVLFKFFGNLAAILPEKITYKLCVGISMLGYKHMSGFRKLARGHLEIAFGDEKSPEEIEEILKQVYVNQGKNLAEFLMIPYKSAEWVNSRVTLNDPNQYLKKEIDKGKGVVAVGAHIGSIELVCAWIGVQKFPMVTIVKAQRDALFNKFLMQTRSKWDTGMVFRTRGVKQECFNQLEKGKIVGLVADQNAARAGVFVDFFGKPAATVAGPAHIAMKMGLPVLPSFLGTRNADNTITIHILEPIPMRDTGNYAEDLHYNVQLYTKVIEDFVRIHPTEYLWWHKRWKTKEIPA